MYIWNRDAAVAMYTGFGFFEKGHVLMSLKL